MGRTIGLNRAYDALWRHPIRDLRKLAEDGGPFERSRTERGHLEMMRAAKSLPPVQPPVTNNGARVHILTGEKFWHQSVFCIASLQLSSSQRITPVFYSDGTLDESVQSNLTRIIPWSEFVRSDEIEERLDLVIPEDRFPTLRSRRKTYIHLRKLTDVHSFGPDWKLVLDSDLLFFRAPELVLKWFNEPTRMYMQDIVSNYGYPDDFLEDLAGHPLPDRMNVGLYGLPSSDIDWERIEYWCKRQLDEFGASYLQEQGLMAMIIAGKPAVALPEFDYMLMPPVRHGRSFKSVMYHYVAHSKRSYFQYGWREIERRLNSQKQSQ